MSMQRARDARFRTAPKPMTWELPAAGLLGGLFFIAFTPLVVQGTVAGIVTGIWAWPHDHVWEAIAGFLRGEPGVGLPPDVRQALPPVAAVLVLVGVVEAAVVWALAVAVLWAREAAGNSRTGGLADARQALEALGVNRLRRSASVIRPDLYSRYGR